jgi:hypothetical protein
MVAPELNAKTRIREYRHQPYRVVRFFYIHAERSLNCIACDPPESQKGRIQQTFITTLGLHTFAAL